MIREKVRKRILDEIIMDSKGLSKYSLIVTMLATDYGVLDTDYAMIFYDYIERCLAGEVVLDFNAIQERG